MNEIHYPPVVYRTVKIGDVSYRYKDAGSLEDIVEMMAAVTRRISQECLIACLIDAEQRPRYIQYISQDIRDVRMTDIFTLAISLDMSGISVAHRYQEKVDVPPADRSLCGAITDAAHLLGMSFYGYIVVGGVDITFRSSDDACVSY